MEVREAKENGKGGIDCWIEHPRHGWIPYTAMADDADPTGRDIHAIVQAHMNGEPAPQTGNDFLQPPTKREIMKRARQSASVDKLTFVRGLREMDRYDAFKTAIEAAGSDVKEDWEIAGSINRVDPVFVKVLAYIGLTANDMDALFGIKVMA